MEKSQDCRSQAVRAVLRQHVEHEQAVEFWIYDGNGEILAEVSKQESAAVARASQHEITADEGGMLATIQDSFYAGVF